MTRRYTIKSVLIATAFAGLALGWGTDRYRTNLRISELMDLMMTRESDHEMELLMLDYVHEMSKAADDSTP